MLAPLLTPKAAAAAANHGAWPRFFLSGGAEGDMRAEEQAPGAGTPLQRAGEYGLMGLLALGMCYVLLIANGNAEFGRSASNSAAVQAPWPQPRAGVPGWGAMHAAFADKVRAGSASGQGFDLLMYGDGLVEAWRGTFMGEPSERTRGGADVFQSHFGHKYAAAALGIAGDSTANLMWRLQNGEAPQGLRAAAIVLHIGGSDLTYASFQGDEHIGAAANATAARTVRLAEVLAGAAPGAAVIVLGLLPRGDLTLHPDEAAFALPSKFSGAIERINRHVRHFVGASPGGRYLFVECDRFVLAGEEGGDRIAPDLMPDGVQPNAAGLEQIAQCLAPAIEAVLGHRRRRR